MDGNQVKNHGWHYPLGGGYVNCQFYDSFSKDAESKRWEEFRLHPQNDGTYTIESVAFPEVYLRMAVLPELEMPNGLVGVVNCQWCAGELEKFHIEVI
jgi:hypothetical protein